MTNTFVGSVIVWIVLLLFAVYVSRRRPKDGSEVPPGGFYNMFEMLFEGLMGFVGGIAGGQHFRLIFNVFMTIFLVVLLANLDGTCTGRGYHWVHPCARQGKVRCRGR